MKIRIVFFLFVSVVGWPAFLVPAAAQTGKSKLVKVKDLIVYREEQYYAAFPSLAVRPDGEILCAFRRAPDRRRPWQAPVQEAWDTRFPKAKADILGLFALQSIIQDVTDWLSSYSVSGQRS